MLLRVQEGRVRIMEYTKEQIHDSLLQLQKIGLIEVTGISRDGEEVWGITEYAKTLTDEQIDKLIEASHRG